MTWIYDFPIWFAMSAAIVTMSGIAATGVIVVRRWLKSSDGLQHNDVAGPVITLVGTVLAVMLSFMVVTVWEEFDRSAGNAATEASAVGDLFRLTLTLPEPTRSRIDRPLVAYVHTVLYDEWPAMQHGGVSPRARGAAIALEDAVAGFEPRNAREVNLQAQGLQLVNTFVDARRKRLFDNQQGIPNVLWGSMFFIGALTIGSICLFRVQSWLAHVTMTVFLASVIATIFVLIAEFDYPFRGDIRVPPTAWVTVSENIATMQGSLVTPPH